MRSEPKDGGVLDELLDLGTRDAHYMRSSTVSFRDDYSTDSHRAFLPHQDGCAAPLPGRARRAHVRLKPKVGCVLGELLDLGSPDIHFTVVGLCTASRARI